MSYRRVAFPPADNNPMMYRDVYQQQDADGYHVRVTTTEWIPAPSTFDIPHYPNRYMLFNNKAGEQLYGNSREERVIIPKHTEKKVHVNKHVHFEESSIEGNRPRRINHEDVNAEADDFIKRKHRALELSKTMSMKAFQ
ncbi:hypothetical protein FRX31_030901 [Thalictrum thalictroides]|uniref:Uncharacterized protein n=1 Tax=Thalictrum thalictroides TaxID=46969 RepID=A0A7J6V546_THATH|nr:hypothetical protein FRX31_030901 [Thalictrum thalictroides]